MTTLLVTHPSCAGHDTGRGHPERAERIRAVEALLAQEAFAGLPRLTAPRAADEAILRVHPRDYVEAVKRSAPASGLVRLDGGDTVMSPGTLDAVLHAAGGACAAVDAVMEGRADNAFVAIRPPGHHAERATPMGFCFFNTVCIAAEQARAVHGAERIAIVDFDVHHGNGTQDIYWSDPDVLYCSTHQMPLFPGTGALGERGAHDTIVNAPLAAGTDGEGFREAVETRILPRLHAFRPDIVLVSAGFDAHRLDPLAQCRLTEDDFGWVTGKLMDAAAAAARGRLVSLLEGGYDLDGLTRSAAAHLLTLMGAPA